MNVVCLEREFGRGALGELRLTLRKNFNQVVDLSLNLKFSPLTQKLSTYMLFVVGSLEGNRSVPTALVPVMTSSNTPTPLAPENSLELSAHSAGDEY